MDDPSRLEPVRLCAWCGEAIPPWMRKDAETCSTGCRQKRHRFRVAPSSSAASTPMLFCYADPPYPGLARKYYGCDEVDHVELVGKLVAEFPDGWALSTSSDALDDVLAIIRPHNVQLRVAVWVKGSRPGIAYRARHAWEPLIVVGGRPRRLSAAEVLDDVLVVGTSSRARSLPGALVGMKPVAFAEWMFRLLGAERGDEMIDLFTGSGAIGRAWQLYTSESGERRIPSRLAGATARLNNLQGEDDGAEDSEHADPLP